MGVKKHSIDQCEEYLRISCGCRMSEGGPGWTLKPLTEIKPSSFGKMKQLEKEYGHGDYGDLEKKIPNANDPLFKYVKNHLLPKVSRI